ncbi:MAG: 50S ribosomal protein L25/general stress protein Ctc [Gammaproteobacteria bacterium RIFCSPLOWO2_02_FULL_42_14]|nr:MAG: 50S ribosomal protein L25/general stress protein Ctc [Gammaproteobacteria bacterium RIFCSPHIGHO2_02_FULL_42_43]OGT51560.1 MAG: 50S ribosomal protein L25/general stress protein Ctc [Gammaproteobacteria bacterium RIFCSPHIGHO2_12_FULL_41_25]OGT62259.1 MAG: 50S ribosomal protein L25/general stress protein Ctc [Gammaproteobacteria bacterium RIFCSPLOWO2_02_FULL_42_14]OGT85933.1 MAG: 50S ribosomal protein L25/general stress protein Ctc [Gammaproteobacteria bacterium RIFCSPLOWO2_12_FULL_42_18]
MSTAFEFEGKMREATGRAAVRRLRSMEDQVPAIVYGAGKAPMPISLSHNKVQEALKHEAVYSHILTLKCDGVEEKVVLKALMRHPFKPKIMHMDFLRIDTKQKITMRVPLHFLGEDKAPGLKELGVLSKLITHVEVSCLPLNLPEYISVDISGLNIHDSIHMSQLKMPENVAFAHALDADHDQVVVSIHPPAAEEPEETAAPEVVETVITGQKPEEPVAEGEETKDGKEAKSKDKEKDK